MVEPLLTLTELTKRFGSFVAVDRLSLSVAPGESIEGGHSA